MRTEVTLTAGKRKKKNWFMPGMIIAQTRPIAHIRNVSQGMEVSSVLATAERTSGYGESSSDKAAFQSMISQSYRRNMNRRKAHPCQCLGRQKQ